nr:hypothetical protein KPHV_38010 [Kitasatospora purpeofusca]
MGVDHQEVDRVGTYVEYTESHNPPRYAIPRRRRPVVPVFVLVRVLIAARGGPTRPDRGPRSNGIRPVLPRSSPDPAVNSP